MLTYERRWFMRGFQATLEASLEVGIRIVFDVSKLLTGNMTNPFDFYLTNLRAQAGAALNIPNANLFKFGSVQLSGSAVAEVGVSGSVPPGLYDFNISNLWDKVELAGTYSGQLNISLDVGEGPFKKFFADNSVRVGISSGDIFNKSNLSSIDVTIGQIEVPSCEQQQGIASMFTDNIGDLLKGVVDSANNAAEGMKGKTVSVLGKQILLTDTMTPPKFAVPSVLQNGAMVDLKGTFDKLVEGLGVDFAFCVTPSLCDGELRLELNLSIGKALDSWTPDINNLPDSVKTAGMSGFTAKGEFTGETRFFVNSAIIINNPLATTQTTSLPSTAGNTTCAGNATLLEIAAGVRVSGECHFEAHQGGATPFLKGQLVRTPPARCALPWQRVAHPSLALCNRCFGNMLAVRAFSFHPPCVCQCASFHTPPCVCHSACTIGCAFRPIARLRTVCMCEVT